MSKNSIDIRNAMSMNTHGMSFQDFVEAGQIVIEEKDAIIEAKNAQIAALKESRLLLMNKMVENITEVRLKAVHGMMKARFSIKEIAEILGLDIECINELAELKPK